MNTRVLFEYTVVIIVAIIASAIIRKNFVEVYRIPSTVMQPTFEPGDTLIVAKWRRKLIHGDLIVYASPKETTRDLARRIVGLPGDELEMKSGVLFINGIPLQGKKAPKTTCHLEIWKEKSWDVCMEEPWLPDMKLKVPEGSVYVLTDYRGQPKGPGGTIRPGELIPDRAIKGWVWRIGISIIPYGHGFDWFTRIRVDRIFSKVR